MILGVCLCGGGIKGAVHIGVLQAFEENKINIDLISGASSGSLVATLYALGYSTDEMKIIFEKNYKKINYVEIVKILQLIGGLIIRGKVVIDGLNSGNKIKKIVNNYAKEKGVININQIKKSLLIPSVDFNTGKLIYFSSIKRKNNREYSDEIKYIYDVGIGECVQASCSYPAIFSPCKINGMELIDGGIRENIPWKELKNNGADKVICVTFPKNNIEKCETNIFDIIEGSIKILNHELANYELEGVDYNIKIKTKNIKLLEKVNLKNLYEIGYNEGKKIIEKYIK